MWLTSYLRYKNACETKQHERKERIASLPEEFKRPLTSPVISTTSSSDSKVLRTPIDDRTILSANTRTLVEKVRSEEWTASEVLRAYTRAALAAHARTNCITEVLVDDGRLTASTLSIPPQRIYADPPDPYTGGDGMDYKPLLGMPVSLKDTVSVAGYDACIGYAAWVNQPVRYDSALVRLLRDAGAILYVKTAIPTTLLSFEARSAVFGQCTNPHNPSFSPGGSSGGEAALIALGGSRIGIGTDVAGSVRVPAHYSGVYSVRASAGRFLKTGNRTSMPGQEGVPAVCSPMSRTLDDLEEFWEAVMMMAPWTYDHSVLRMLWKPVTLKEGEVKFGVMWDDGVVPLSPACHRALTTVVDSLRQSGYEVVDFTPPDPVLGLRIASQLLLADAGKTACNPILAGEFNDPGMVSALRWFRLPRLFQWLYTTWVRYIRRDPVYATLLTGFREKTMTEYYALVAEREAYRARWFEAWTENRFDFVLTAPNALPAVPNGGMKKGWKVCGYSFLFNLLDYTAGVLPVTKVSSTLDVLTGPPSFSSSSSAGGKGNSKLNAIAVDAFEMYDAEKMNGLPVGVQVVGQRLEEEKVIAGMKLVEKVLKERGVVYELLSL